MSVDLSGEITAIATAVLAVFAIVTAVFAFLAFRKQTEEVRAIERQVTDQEELTRQQAELLKVQSGQLELQSQQFEREAIERHREQASRVSIVLAPSIHLPADETAGPALNAMVLNASHGQQPVYNAKLHWYMGSERYGTPNPEPIGPVPAYDRTERLRRFPAGTDLTICGAFLTFHDAAGYAWMRAPDGALTEHSPDELDDAAQAAITARTSPPRSGAISPPDSPDVG